MSAFWGEGVRDISGSPHVKLSESRTMGYHPDPGSHQTGCISVNSPQRIVSGGLEVWVGVVDVGELSLSILGAGVDACEQQGVPNAMSESGYV